MLPIWHAAEAVVLSYGNGAIAASLSNSVGCTSPNGVSVVQNSMTKSIDPNATSMSAALSYHQSL